MQRNIQIWRPSYHAPITQNTKVDISFPHFVCAIESLLDNAIKYSFDGHEELKNKIYIDINRDDDDHNYCKISIKNVGFAVTDEEQQKQDIFRAHTRGQAAKQLATHEASKGLGLAIAQEIISVHQGTIEVSSKRTERQTITHPSGMPAHVTVFTIRIPFHHRA